MSPRFFLFLVSIAGSMLIYSQSDIYDPALAEKLGADEHGMRSYQFVLLTTGPAKELTKEVRESLFTGHMQNIKRLADEGKLIVAGPFGKNDRYRGLFIFTTTNKEETEALLLTDPAISGGALAYEIYPWYGSAALMEVTGIHERISRK